MLAIGRALMTNPRLLILDEATEGLAPIIRQEIWASVAQLKAQSGVAILVIDKTLSELRGVCDRAVILERGRTVWSGAMAALIPTRYPGSEKADGLSMLARATVWQDAGEETYTGLGQRLLAIGDEDIAIMDVRTLKMDGHEIENG